MSTTELSSLLQSAGGWGLSAILMGLTAFLMRHIVKLNDDRDKRSTEQNDQMFAMLEKKIETDIKHEQAFNNLARTIEKLTDRL